jgi:hypothetical protein
MDKVNGLVQIFQGGNNKNNNEDANKTPPPPTPINKIKYSGPPYLKKDKKQSSSRFNVSKNRELKPLPLLKGMIFFKFNLLKVRQTMKWKQRTRKRRRKSQ